VKFPPRAVALLTATAVLMAIPAPASATEKLLHKGSSGSDVKTLQQFLDRNKRGDFYKYRVATYDSQFGPATKAGLQRWQHATGHRSNGKIRVGSAQWQQLKREATARWRALGVSSTTLKLAHRHHLAVDATKTAGAIYVLHYSNKRMHIILRTPASFGGYIDGAYRPTANGVWRFYRRGGRYDHSPEWHNAPMPWSVYFNGGEAIHYDALGPSHGCIHVPSMRTAYRIQALPLGTRIVVH
jgi:hypothetical protein